MTIGGGGEQGGGEQGEEHEESQKSLSWRDACSLMTVK